MKISVIGTGKTGSKVVDLLGKNLLDTFDENKPPTIEKLKKADALIIFVPGNAVDTIINVVLASTVPAVWGSTGYKWPQDLNHTVQSMRSKWILANNFSLGMNLIRKAFKSISNGLEILKAPHLNIHEVHHVHKKDAPSGTALSWEKWLNQPVSITSKREGDINGFHELTITTNTEKITISHEALDRSIFAEGAIWAVEQLVSNKHLKDGVHTFSELFDLTPND